MNSKLLEKFKPLKRHSEWADVSLLDWNDWRWQMRHALTKLEDFKNIFKLSDSETRGLEAAGVLFKVTVTPYYASLASQSNEKDPIRRIFMPTQLEMQEGSQQMLDPLGEKKNQAAPRVIHRYTDRVLFWITDTCSVYCRYCTRKHFTAKGQALASDTEYKQSLEYIRQTKQIREVILSGGDPLTVSDSHLEKVLADLRDIDHVEIIRIGTRMPVVNPMRITDELVAILKKYQPVFLMAHFNHPHELTHEAYQALAKFVDSGIPVLNQMVLLNGVNNHERVVEELSRKLLLARVKPYYMFQCDPSLGTDHLRTSVEDSLDIQKKLWGHLSGIAMPTLSLDIPDGGGKVTLVPNFQTAHNGNVRTFTGWDGVTADYISPPAEDIIKPI